MPKDVTPRPHTRALALTDLLSRSGRARRIGARARNAIKTQIAQTGRYPALIVRPAPKRRGKYEIIDGHFRAEILAELGCVTARCELWPVDDGEAGLLALALNQSWGRCDARGRARALKKLIRRLGVDQTADRLGLTSASLRRHVQQASPPKLSPQGPALEMVPVVFHLPADKAEVLAGALNRFGAGRSGRAEALTRAVEAGLAAKTEQED